MNGRWHLLCVAALTLVVSGGRLAAQTRDGRAEAEFFENHIRPVLVDFVEWAKRFLPLPARHGASNPVVKAPLDLSLARRFWSLQPIKVPPLPKIIQADWPRAALDYFILAKLEVTGMKPSPPADKRTLLRRATFDLTGLPPTAEELDSFLADTSPEAYARAVDRLLTSSQYGVKWGRHWLDIARYGDTRWVGAGEDKRWPFAYTYRDWVIQALNEDMPYDRFVTLQLAADQVPGAKPREQAALGFLTVSRWFTGTLPDVIDDQIDVVTRGLLGLTVQCARCHDHKYDPISTKDYYSLYGLLAASRMPVEGIGLMAELAEVSPRPVDLATENELVKLRAQEDRYLLERLTAVRNEYRTPEKMAQYLLAAESVVKKTDNDVRALAKRQSLNEHILFRWVRFLQRTLKNPQPRRTESPTATPTERITSLYRLVFGRRPSAEELAIGLEFVAASAPAPAETASDAWRYGYGSYSETQRRVVEFEPFPFFANGQWKGGPQEDDPYFGRLALHARGGNAGRDSSLAVIRRWIAPRDGKVSIAATLSVQPNAIQPSGDGARGRIVSSRQGQLGVWLVHGTEEMTNVADVTVQHGDTIDFVIDARGRDTHTGFTWAPVVRMEGAPNTPKTTKLIWDAAKDFAGAPVGVKHPSPWERFAQVLLEANEFLFLD